MPSKSREKPDGSPCRGTLYSTAGMPFAELPALEVDGQTIVQSLAIARYIAKKHGLAGQGDMEAAKADMIVDGCSDFINKGRDSG